MYLKLVVILAIITVSSAYNDVDDSLLYDEIATNNEKLQQFFGCFLESNTCTDNELRIKKHLTESISNNCADCDAEQKHMAVTALKAIKKKFPEKYEEFKARYDIDGKHLEAFELSLESFVKSKKPM